MCWRMLSVFGKLQDIPVQMSKVKVCIGFRIPRCKTNKTNQMATKPFGSGLGGSNSGGPGATPFQTGPGEPHFPKKNRPSERAPNDCAKKYGFEG